MSATGAVVTRKYGSFRGVDFRGDEIHISRSPDSLNVWRDYKGNLGICTRPGMTLDTGFDDNNTTYGIYFYKGSMIVHRGNMLYEFNENGRKELRYGVSESKANAFIHNGIWYFKDADNYYQYDGNEIKYVDGFIPTTSINRAPDGGGETYQEVNLIQPLRRNTFVGDGKSTVFRLDTDDIDSEFTPIIKIASIDDEINNFDWDYKAGIITFKDAPPAAVNGVDNIEILFNKTVEGYTGRILGCTLLQVFDNRVFVSGNPNYPNYVWHCSLDDPTYFSDQDVYKEGLDPSLIRGLVAGNNALWVFREPSDSNTNVFYHTPTIDSEFGKVYPSQHSSIATGCVGGAINFNDDIVFFSPEGMEGISGSITTEQFVAHRSSLVDRTLTADNRYRDMVLAEWEGYLMVFIGDKVYLADSRTAFNNDGHKEYDWYYWELKHNITCACVHDGELYLGTANGVYKLSDNSDEKIESYWTTPKDKFNAPNLVKTTNKRGCVVEGTGDITVYSKTEGTEFTLIGEFNGIKDYFVPRIKEKKFKDIQLKFHSNTRFSLETATLEAFIGGYIKR